MLSGFRKLILLFISQLIFNNSTYLSCPNMPHHRHFLYSVVTLIASSSMNLTLFVIMVESLSFEDGATLPNIKIYYYTWLLARRQLTIFNILIGLKLFIDSLYSEGKVLPPKRINRESVVENSL